jgi:hypothetical protein
MDPAPRADANEGTSTSTSSNNETSHESQGAYFFPGGHGDLENDKLQASPPTAKANAASGEKCVHSAKTWGCRHRHQTEYTIRKPDSKDHSDQTPIRSYQSNRGGELTGRLRPPNALARHQTTLPAPEKPVTQFGSPQHSSCSTTGS